MLTPEQTAGFCVGDPESVRAVYREYGRLVFAVAHRTLGSRELAEEATQQTFVKAWQSASTFEPSRDLGPWLATIARRTAIDLYRRESRRRTESLSDLSSEPATVVDLQDSVVRSLDVWSLRQAVEDLPPEEREVVRLQHLEQLSQTEVAEKLGLPIGTVKSRSFRAHQRLAARLGHLREHSE